MATGIKQETFGPYINNKCILIGDSTTQFGVGTGTVAGSAYADGRGWFNWFQFYTGHPFKHYVGYRADQSLYTGHNMGISAQRTDHMMKRFSTDVEAARPGLVNILAGTNDITQYAYNYKSIAGRLDWLVRASRDFGARVWLHTIFPRSNKDVSQGNSNKNFTTAQYQVWLDTNKAIEDLADRRDGVRLIDNRPLFADNNNQFLSQYTQDGTHLLNNGAAALGRLLIPIYEEEIGINQSTKKIIYPQPEAYGATYNQYGDMMVNPRFATTTGGTAGTGATGTVPNLFDLNRAAGSVMTVSSVVKQNVTDFSGNLTNEVELTVTLPGGGASATTERIRLENTNVVTTGVATGTWYQGFCEIEKSASKSCRSFYLELDDTTATIGRTMRMFNRAYNYTDTTTTYTKFPNTPERGLLVTPPLRAMGTTGFTLTLAVEGEGTETDQFTIKTRNMQIVPMPNWPDELY